jgi:hypothetical protein
MLRVHSERALLSRLLDINKSVIVRHDPYFPVRNDNAVLLLKLLTQIFAYNWTADQWEEKLVFSTIVCEPIKPCSALHYSCIRLFHSSRIQPLIAQLRSNHNYGTKRYCMTIECPPLGDVRTGQLIVSQFFYITGHPPTPRLPTWWTLAAISVLPQSGE